MQGLKGDLVLGRHTWKEYIRGLHEGWLGPLDAPVSPEPETPQPSPSSKTEGQKKSEEKKLGEEEKKPPKTPPAYISTQSYSLSPLAATTPSLLEPSQPLHQQHLLGFLKTPRRVYNFLTRRYLADELGRDTAAIVLAACRPYSQSEQLVSDLTVSPHEPESSATILSTRSPEFDAHESSTNIPLSINDPASRTVLQTVLHWEQQESLSEEESYWHKSARKASKDKADHHEERIWLDGVVMDPRIAQRMRKFILTPEEEARAGG